MKLYYIADDPLLPIRASPNDLYCVEWDVKPYSTQLPISAGSVTAKHLLCDASVIDNALKNAG